ncbi:MAG: hypothetical protein H7146_14235 [Burkholderiaceae bacterium]|nr:hypothetical protein [Microbacteriaceae bacterium]
MALKASPADQALLLDLQALDTKLQQLDHRSKALPELAAIAKLQVEADRLRLARTTESGVVDDTTTELRRIEADVVVVEARIARDDARLQASTSVKDVAGLESELAGLRRRRDELEEIELAVMEKLETLENAAQITAAEHADVLAQIQTIAAERDESLGALTTERGNVVADRAAISGRLPADLVALYERQRSRYGYGASHLRGGVSSASGVKLLENEMAIVRSAAPDDVLICPDSQAVLIRTAESGLTPKTPAA